MPKSMISVPHAGEIGEPQRKWYIVPRVLPVPPPLEQPEPMIVPAPSPERERERVPA